MQLSILNLPQTETNFQINLDRTITAVYAMEISKFENTWFESDLVQRMYYFLIFLTFSKNENNPKPLIGNQLLNAVRDNNVNN